MLANDVALLRRFSKNILLGMRADGRFHSPIRDFTLPRFQFSLARMMILVTVVAILLGPGA